MPPIAAPLAPRGSTRRRRPPPQTRLTETQMFKALLVDKDKQPRWEHPDLASVPRAEVLELFTQ